MPTFRLRRTDTLLQLKAVPIYGKMAGAVGNYNAHISAYPDVQWDSVADQFVSDLGLQFNPYVTQVGTSSEQQQSAAFVPMPYARCMVSGNSSVCCIAASARDVTFGRISVVACLCLSSCNFCCNRSLLCSIQPRPKQACHLLQRLEVQQHACAFLDLKGPGLSKCSACVQHFVYVALLS